MRMTTSLILACVVAAGCSGKSDADDGHVWKEQTDALKKAEQVEDVLKKSAAEQRQQIDDT